MNSAATSIERAESPDVVDYTFTTLTPYRQSAESARIRGGTLDARRVLNVVLAALILTVTSPLMLLIAIAIKLTSPGPVIFRQTRVGIDRRTNQISEWGSRRKVDFGGRLYTMYKFRTMRADGDSAVQVWARAGDDRITPIGRLLRKYRLDELPQMVNVLKGDMNIVGPRPEQPKIFLTLRTEVDSYQRRQRVLPGITGWAQVNQSYDTSVEDVKRKVRYDLEYIEKQSPWYDLRILALTVPVVVFRRGAL